MTGLSLWGAAFGDQCSTNGEGIWGWIFYPAIMLYCFYILARVCDGHLTTALEFIVERIQLSEDVAGATFLAMASSAPELFCSLVSTFLVPSSSGVGNIVGSAVFNLLVIIGVTPVFAGGDLNIWWYPTIRDASFYTLAIIEIFVVLQDGLVYWYEGLIMVLSYALYVFYFFKNQRICQIFGLKNPNLVEDADVEAPPQEVAQASLAGTGGTGGTGVDDAGKSDEEFDEPSPNVRSTSKNNFSLRGQQDKERLSFNKVFPECIPHQVDDDTTGAQRVSEPGKTVQESTTKGGEDEEGGSGCCRYEPIMLLLNATIPSKPERLVLMFAMCCFWIGVFTYFAVDAAERLGCLLNMPHVVMGLVFLAAGTSVPDAIGSIAVARDGMGDMAVANAVGSNTFDILLGLGLPWFLKAAIDNEPIRVESETILEAVFILMFCLVFYLAMLMYQKWVLTRRGGYMLLVIYCGAITFFLVRHYTKH
eukprot:TRINITY_DN25684_c0_g4_i1.p1 TRINITY_DN25684_c0_g4~~TRINITY_DN25684_c0_g4_i1.p1  ORF type:complete len:477 (+),score=54.18 TRINITY_DN25684_c0_g4_i1:36-1466(+)